MKFLQLAKLYLLASCNASEISIGVMGVLFGGVAGIIVFISLDELLSTSRAYGKVTTAFSGWWAEWRSWRSTWSALRW